MARWWDKPRRCAMMLLPKVGHGTDIKIWRFDAFHRNLRVEPLRAPVPDLRACPHPTGWRADRQVERTQAGRCNAPSAHCALTRTPLRSACVVPHAETSACDPVQASLHRTLQGVNQSKPTLRPRRCPCAHDRASPYPTDQPESTLAHLRFINHNPINTALPIQKGLHFARTGHTEGEHRVVTRTLAGDRRVCESLGRCNMDWC